MTAPNTSGGTAAGTQNGDSNNNSNNREGGRRYLTSEEVTEQVQTMLARNGNNAERTIATLINDNRRTRDKLRETKEKAERLEAGQKGATILTGDDAKEYKAFKDLKLPAADIKARIEKATTLEASQAKTDRAAVLKTAAEALGFNAEVFTDLVESKGLHVELRDGMVNDKPVKLPYIRPAADDKAPLLLAKDYVGTNLAGYVPALTTKPTSGAGGATATGSSVSGATAGTQFPAQSGGASTASPTGNGGAADGTPPLVKPLPGQERYMTPGMRRQAAEQRHGN